MKINVQVKHKNRKNLHTTSTKRMYNLSDTSCSEFLEVTSEIILADSARHFPFLANKYRNCELDILVHCFSGSLLLPRQCSEILRLSFIPTGPQ